MSPKERRTENRELRAHQLKICSKCGETLPLTDFHSHKKTYDGLRHSCKRCRRAHKLQRRATPGGRLGAMITETRVRAHQLGYAHDISLEWAKKQLEAQDYKCRRTNRPFVFITSPGATYIHSPWAPSFDRIDSTKGYTQDNVQIVCYMYNVAKNEFTDDDVRSFAFALAGQNR